MEGYKELPTAVDFLCEITREKEFPPAYLFEKEFCEQLDEMFYEMEKDRYRDGQEDLVMYFTSTNYTAPEFFPFLADLVDHGYIVCVHTHNRKYTSCPAEVLRWENIREMTMDKGEQVKIIIPKK